MATTNPETLTGDTLRLWRERMGYSERVACTELGCSRNAFSRWQSGGHPVPRYIGLATAALALGMKPYAGTPQAWMTALSYSERDSAEALGCSRRAWGPWKRNPDTLPRYIGLAMSVLANGLTPFGALPASTVTEPTGK